MSSIAEIPRLAKQQPPLMPKRHIEVLAFRDRLSGTRHFYLACQEHWRRISESKWPKTQDLLHAALTQLGECDLRIHAELGAQVVIAQARASKLAEALPEAIDLTT